MPVPEDVKHLIEASDNVVQRSKALQKEAEKQSGQVKALLSTSNQICSKAPRGLPRVPAEPRLNHDSDNA